MYQHGRANQPDGVEISVESAYEWKIQEIGYDGVERHIKPQKFVDHIESLARKVNWSKIIGSTATYDNPDTIPRFVEDEMEEWDRNHPPQENFLIRRFADAGPWHPVAKFLHEALHHVNTLVDTLSVLKTPYLEAITVAETFEMNHNIQDIVQQSKQFHWVTKRKALTEASAVMEQSLKSHAQFSCESEPQIELFFLELQKMRENWRVRKTGNVIYGDLGYRIYAPKFNQKEVFWINRYSSSNPSHSQTNLHVIVPCNLAYRTAVYVSIERDNSCCKSLWVADGRCSVSTEDAQSKYTAIPWQSALSWAQNTLICNDMFKQICDDAVVTQDRMSIFRDNVLMISIFGDILLRIELCHYPFACGPLPKKGDRYLSGALRRIYLSDVCSKSIRSQTFVTMPFTTVPDNFDLSGPLAFTNEEIQIRSSRKQILLQRFIGVAFHQILVGRVINALENLMLRISDPQVTWRWLRCSPMQSCTVVTLSSRTYDHAGRTSFHIKVDSNEFYVTTKEGFRFDCWYDEAKLIHAMTFLMCNHMLTTVTMIANKLWSWQVLHANINAINDNGEHCPTLYICNQNSTYAIFIKFDMSLLPIVMVHKRIKDNRLSTNAPEDFTQISLDRLNGSSFFRKIDFLCEILKY